MLERLLDLYHISAPFLKIDFRISEPEEIAWMILESCIPLWASVVLSARSISDYKTGRSTGFPQSVLKMSLTLFLQALS